MMCRYKGDSGGLADRKVHRTLDVELTAQTTALRWVLERLGAA